MAAISANSDSEIGEIIADAMDKSVKTEPSLLKKRRASTTLETVEGMQFDKGYSPYFVTNSDDMSVVLEDAYVLIHEKKIAISTISFSPAIRLQDWQATPHHR